MIRNYKGFALALLAIFAFSAFAAQSALAHPLTITTTPVPEKVFITGIQETEHVFTNEGGTVRCTTSTWSASATPVSGAISELTLAPTYTGCSAFGFATAHVKVNGCTYTLTTPTTTGVAGEVTWHPSQIHVLCPAGKSIEITPTAFGASICTQFIGEQTPTSGHIIARNAGTAVAMDITDEVTVKGIHYTGSGGICGNGETHSDAEYSGNTTAKCYSDAGHTKQVGCTFS